MVDPAQDNVLRSSNEQLSAYLISLADRKQAAAAALGVPMHDFTGNTEIYALREAAKRLTTEK